MFVVYVLWCANSNFYIGYTKDIRKRYFEHKSGKVIATKSKLPAKLIYFEACINKYDALKREKYLKSGPGRKYIKYRLRNYLQ